MNLPITARDGGIQFGIAVQPRASKNEIAGIHNDRLKIRLTSPPVEGAANQACVKFLAKQFGVAASRVTLVSGAASRNKVVHIQGLDRAAFLNRLEASISGGK